MSFAAACCYYQSHHGLGHLGRLNDSLRRLYARSPSSTSASSGASSGSGSGSGSGSTKIASTSDVSSAVSSASVFSRKRKASHAESSSIAKRVVSGSNAVRPAPYCYLCNSDGHLSPQCRVEGYADKNAFRPVNGVRPSGGLRGKPSSARVGFLGPAAASVASVSDLSSPFLAFVMISMMVTSYPFCRTRSPVRKKKTTTTDDLHAFYPRVRTLNVIDQDSSSNCISALRFRLTMP
ncbi:hypothetical protein B0O80DRAFT_429624 [Mortierella sp. GBAus27b]|nr:hypothetical protein B0O80DRAFT_429624 [Mortierella sp. GBAus27b]